MNITCACAIMQGTRRLSYYRLEETMKLSAPKQITFWIAVALAVLGVIVKLIPSLSKFGLSGWLILIGFVVLAAGNLVENL